MEWIINSLANVILETLNDMLYWTVNLVEGFSLNIGLSGPKYGQGANVSQFEDLLKVRDFLQPIMVLAFFIVIACAILKLYQAMGGPFTQSEEPGVILIRTAFAGIGVGMSYSIFTGVETLFNLIYINFVSIYKNIGILYNNADWNLILKRNDSAGSSASGATATQTQGTFTAGDIDLPQAGSNVFSVFGGDSLIKDVTPTMGLIILEAIIGCTLLISFFKLVLEVYERYVLIGVMYITAPLAFSTLISKQSTIFKNWCQMLVCQFILMCMNLVFLGGFIAAWYALLAPLSAGQEYVFESEQKYFSTMFIMIGWLLAGQKMDEHLRSLGLSAATTGSGIMGAMMGGMALAATAFRMSSGVARSVGTNAHNAMTGQTKVQKDLQAARDGRSMGLYGATFGNNAKNRAAREAAEQQRDSFNAEKMADYHADKAAKTALEEANATKQQALLDPDNHVKEAGRFSGSDWMSAANAAAKEANLGAFKGANNLDLDGANFHRVEYEHGSIDVFDRNDSAASAKAIALAGGSDLNSSNRIISLKDTNTGVSLNGVVNIEGQKTVSSKDSIVSFTDNGKKGK